MKTELILIAIVAMAAASLSAFAQDAAEDLNPPAAGESVAAGLRGYQEGLCTVAQRKI